MKGFSAFPLPRGVPLEHITEGLRRFFTIYADIFFTNNLAIGVIIFCVTFFQPNVGTAGFAAIAFAYLFRRLTFPAAESFEPFYYYNALLVGLSIGALFRISPLTLLMIAAAAVFTFALTVSLNSVFSRYLGIPILSFPFAIVSSLCYLFAIRSTNLFVNNLLPHTSSTWSLAPTSPAVTGFLKTLGAIFFNDTILAGGLILLAVLLHSRIFFLLAAAGYSLGALIIAHFYGAYTSTFANLNYFNFILIAVALGGIFLIPSPRSYLTALIAVAVSSILLGAVEVFWAGFSIPIFTLPFNLIVGLFLHYFNITGGARRTITFLESPEAILDHHINYAARFLPPHPAIGLPFSGEWTLSQAFDGEYTHKGPWRYGADFLIRDSSGREHSDNGTTLSDYYAFGKPVLAPVAGRVVKIVSDVEDNAPGEANRAENWGNTVLIWDERGFYVKVAHLAKGSVSVTEGQFVAHGQKIGLCGNSGYSPMPHIHVQLQLSPEANSPTIPFCFSNVVRDGISFHSWLEPRRDIVLASPIPSSSLRSSFSPLLGETFLFERTCRGRSTVGRFEVVLAPDGRNLLTDGENELFFHTGPPLFRFLDYSGDRRSILADLFRALPSIPLIQNRVAWSDTLPIRPVISRGTAEAVLLVQSFHHDFARIHVRGTVESDTLRHTKLYRRIGRRKKLIEEWTVTLDRRRLPSTLYSPTRDVLIRRLEP